MSRVLEIAVEKHKLDQELCELLGVNVCNYQLEFELQSKWSDCGVDIQWLDNGDVYGTEVVRDIRVNKNGYTTVLNDNGCGETFYMVFDDKNKVQDVELLEEKV